ncbi:hypothetical protein [Nonomuraea wenchangensis]|uniref:hypothetical protein n=1 Tax=Nonomuraea wenchangensis TaxID=568860 RepID=UPI0034241E68
MIKPGEEPDVVAGQVPAGGSVLDLGAGVGRMRLTDEQLGAALEEAGLRLDRFVTDDRVWVKAVPSAAS